MALCPLYALFSFYVLTVCGQTVWVHSVMPDEMFKPASSFSYNADGCVRIGRRLPMGLAATGGPLAPTSACRGPQNRGANVAAEPWCCGQVCLHCGGGGDSRRTRERAPGGIVCDSLDCGVYYERRKVAFEMAAAAAQQDNALPLLDC